MKRADRVFTMMLGLALASSAILLALLLTLAPRVEQLAARGAEDTADVVAVLVLLLAVCGISLGLLTLFRQLVATAVLIRGLVAQKIALPSVVVVAASGLDLDGRIDVVTDERPFSFCYWFLRPRICLSTGLVERLDPDELRAVLYHERYHLRQRDPLRQIVARYFAPPRAGQLALRHRGANRPARRRPPALGRAVAALGRSFRGCVGRRGGTRRVQGRRERRLRNFAAALCRPRTARRTGKPVVRRSRRRRPASAPTADSATVHPIDISPSLLHGRLVAELRWVQKIRRWGRGGPTECRSVASFRSSLS